MELGNIFYPGKTTKEAQLSEFNDRKGVVIWKMLENYLEIGEQNKRSSTGQK